MANTYTSLFYHIQNQRDHHQKQDFQAEYLEFLRRHGSNTMNAMCGDDDWVVGGI